MIGDRRQGSRSARSVEDKPRVPRRPLCRRAAQAESSRARADGRTGRQPDAQSARALDDITSARTTLPLTCLAPSPRAPSPSHAPCSPARSLLAHPASGTPTPPVARPR